MRAPRTAEDVGQGWDQVLRGGHYGHYDGTYVGRGEVITPGGFTLLRRVDRAILLNLDIGLLVRPASLRRWRERILQASERTGVPVIPVGLTAYRSGVGIFSASTLVSRSGMEAVFRVGDNYYLSGYDTQESPPLYFLCQLPRPVKSVAEARLALRPKSVNDAILAGIPVRRQGDLFLIKSPYKRRHLILRGAKFVKGVGIYGTAHTADEIAVMPSGVALIKGTMTHQPRLIGDDRGPDHHPLKPGRGWWWVARNTVPVRGSTRRPTR